MFTNKTDHDGNFFNVFYLKKKIKARFPLIHLVPNEASLVISSNNCLLLIKCKQVKFKINRPFITFIIILPCYTHVIVSCLKQIFNIQIIVDCWTFVLSFVRTADLRELVVWSQNHETITRLYQRFLIQPNYYGNLIYKINRENVISVRAKLVLLKHFFQQNMTFNFHLRYFVTKLN